MVSLLMTYRYEWGWIAILVLIGIVKLTLFWVVKNKPELRVQILSGAVAALIIGIALPTLLIWNTQSQSYEHLKNQVSQLTSHIVATGSDVKTIGETLMANPTLLKIAREGITVELQADLQHLMVSNQFSLLTVTSPRGLVQGRAHATTHHDNLVTSYPWFISALRGDTITGTAYGEDGVPHIVVGMPLLEDGVIVGGIMIGKSLESVIKSDPTGHSFAVATLNGITSFTSKTPTEVRIFQSAALDEALQERLTASKYENTYFQMYVTSEEERYRVVGNSFGTLIPTQSLALITLDPDQAKQPTPWMIAGLTTLASLLIAGGLFWLLRKEPRA